MKHVKQSAASGTVLFFFVNKVTDSAFCVENDWNQLARKSNNRIRVLDQFVAFGTGQGGVMFKSLGVEVGFRPFEAHRPG